MKRGLIVILLTLAICVSFAVNQNISVSNKATEMKITKSDQNGLSINYQIGEIELKDVNTTNGVYTGMSISGYSATEVIGNPALPVNRKLIAVPINAVVTASVTNIQKQEYNLSNFNSTNRVYPVQLSIAKNVDPATVALTVNENTYRVNAYDNAPVVQVTEIGFMRGMRVFEVLYKPVSYNPVSNKIEVYKKGTVNIEFSNGDWSATTNLMAKTRSPFFESVYGTVINHEIFNERVNFTQYPVKYLIISDPMFQTQLQPFIDWKTQQGFTVILGLKGSPEVGSTKESIKAYIQSLYNAGTPEDPAPTYLLIVGDVAQIPAWTGTTDSGHITDLNYVKITGNDYLPEMFFARFSANNVNELQPQIDKTLMYEKYTMPDPSYLGSAVMIAGVDGNYGQSHANGQINTVNSLYMNPAHGITPNTYLYPGSGNSDAAIISNVSQGTGWVNYTAHGSETSWSDPSFTINNINSLQNNGKYPFVIGNCCLTSSFQVQTCFGEAWLRVANKGAIGYIGGTNSSYWNEDYWWALGNGTIPASGAAQAYTPTIGAYDGIFHDHAEPFSEWYTTAAALNYCGNLAVQQTNSTLKSYYWEIYSLMGDPSLSPYLGVPTVNEANYLPTLFIGMTSMQITAEPYSYVGLTMNGVIYGSGIVDATGNLTLTIDPITTPGDAILVITCQNKQPIIANIQVIPNEGAYVVVNSNTPTDNNNNIPEFGETMSLNLNLNNVGVVAANNLLITLRSSDPYITILDSTETAVVINASGTLDLVNAFSFSISNNVPDQHSAGFEVIITDGESHLWTSNINITIAAPALAIGTITINETAGNNNSMLDPGETAELVLKAQNNGHAASLLSDFLLVSAFAGLTIENSLVQVNPIAPEGFQNLTFNISVDADVPAGSVAQLAYLWNGIQSTISLTIGLIYEDFESGDFTEYPWTMQGGNWTIATTGAQQGQNCAKSAAIANSTSTSISVTMDIVSAGTISFYKKVSSESNYDYLKFYINNVEKGAWSGTVNWTQETFPVEVGNNVFKWTYSKDGSQTGGSDCAWIDYVVFPAAGGNTTPMPISYINADSLIFSTINVGTTETKSITLYNLGNAEMNGTITTPAPFFINGNQSSFNYTIPANSNINVEIVFAPTDTTQYFYSGNLVITTNDTNHPQYSLVVEGSTPVGANDPVEPRETKLIGNYPNPFNPTTTIRFSLNENSNVSLDIFNIKGQHVKSLVKENLNSGMHNKTWDGKDQKNKNVSSGIYFYKLQTGKYNSIKKMILVK